MFALFVTNQRPSGLKPQEKFPACSNRFTSRQVAVSKTRTGLTLSSCVNNERLLGLKITPQARPSPLIRANSRHVPTSNTRVRPSAPAVTSQRLFELKAI